MKIIILFDLDGTITEQETLPIISHALGLFEKINVLTQDTIKGNIPFIESFIKRVNILSGVPVSQVIKIFNNIYINNQIVKFIRENSEYCAIVTGNLDCWVGKFCEKITMNWYSSKAIVNNDRITKINTILKKDDVVKEKQNEGYKVVFIGEGNNDSEAMRFADIAIAYGGVHHPARSVLSIADYAVYNGGALCRLLKQLL